jgi:ADP-ribosylglycohydrolase
MTSEPHAGGFNAMPRSTSPSVNSALWAAWGDALGFPVEMVKSPAMLRRRVGSDRVELPPKWSRRVGGRGGPTTALPAGSYSDDTQLRLAVARCIRGSGRFDVEAFSKIELPVFLSYELGAGRATRAAAHALTRRGVRWHSNFFAGRDVAYVNGGGNGAAMRIQPHVWAALDHRAGAYLPGLLRDAVTTHGHPRGILGAAWHALALGAALRDGEVPGPAVWVEMVRSLERIPSRIEADERLDERWLPQWQSATGEPFATAALAVVDECADLAELAARTSRGGGSLEDRYAALAREAGGLRAATRGSGTVSALLSLWLAWSATDDPARGVRAAANLLGSDTDTVATMTGALLGAVSPSEPPGELLDRDLHVREAERLDRLREGTVAVSDFPHPDTLGWEPPPTLSDAVGTVDGSLAVSGLGPCRARGEPVPGDMQKDLAWQWLETEFGQSLLIKRRAEIVELPPTALPRRRRVVPPESDGEQISVVAGQAGLPDRVDDALAMVLERDFDERTIGRLVLHFGVGKDGEARTKAFVELVARAFDERAGGDRGRSPSPLDGDQLALLK